MAGAYRFIKHFSHPHMLGLSTFHSPQGLTNPSTLCSCCKLAPSLEICICRPCNFILHLCCSQIPKSLTHSAHGNHTLTLLPTAAYPSGLFGCDACGKPGNGFNYHCSSCSYDLHAKCAHMPFNFTHQSHECPLSLTFKVPFAGTAIMRFSCNICGESIGSSDWRYRCSACDFDVHLGCCWNKASPARGVVGGSQAQVPQRQYNRYLPSARTNQPQAQRPSGLGTAFARSIAEGFGLQVGRSVGQAIFGDGTGGDHCSYHIQTIRLVMEMVIRGPTIRIMIMGIAVAYGIHLAASLAFKTRIKSYTETII